MKSVLVRQWRYGSIIFNFVKMNRVAFNSTPLSLLWLMFCAMINASDPTFHLFCGFKYPPSCFCVCWKMKMQIRSMKQVNFVNSSIHYSGLKYPPSCFSVYLENKNAYLKQETSEIVVKSIHHGGFLFNFIIINLKSSENKERWRLSTVSYSCCAYLALLQEAHDHVRRPKNFKPPQNNSLGPLLVSILLKIVSK